MYDRVKPSDDAYHPQYAVGSGGGVTSASSPDGAADAASPPFNPEAIIDPPESEERRRLELQLFWHYVSTTGPTFAMDDVSEPLWVKAVCSMAFRSDALLYCTYLLAAVHRSKDPGCPNSREMLTHCRTYLNMALRELHRDIAKLSADNVNQVCLTSSLLRIHGFMRLQERELEPYVPPVQWLRMTGTSNVVFRRAANLTEDQGPTSIGWRMIEMVMHLVNEEKTRPYLEGLGHLLRREKPHELAEAWDDDVEDAYKSAVNAIGGIWQSMNNGQPIGGVGRRLVVFPVLMDKRFVDLVEEERPRALVILAHYFALLSMLQSFWWIGDTGPREVRAIVEEVGPEWEDMMSWPQTIIRDEIVFTQDGASNAMSALQDEFRRL